MIFFVLGDKKSKFSCCSIALGEKLGIMDLLSGGGVTGSSCCDGGVVNESLDSFGDDSFDDDSFGDDSFDDDSFDDERMERATSNGRTCVSSNEHSMTCCFRPLAVFLTLCFLLGFSSSDETQSSTGDNGTMMLCDTISSSCLVLVIN